MRVVNQAEELAVWFFDRGYDDVVAGFSCFFMNGAAVLDEVIQIGKE